MQKYLATFLMFSILSASGCRNGRQNLMEKQIQKDLSSIQGVFEGGEAREIILEEMAVREYIPVDSVICDEKGQFSISFKQEKTAFFVLRTGSSGYITLLLEPGEKISLRGRYGDTNLYSVEGSPGSMLLMELSAEHKKTLDELAQLSRQNREHMNSPDYARHKMQLDYKFDSITNHFKAYSLAFIENNQSSLTILIALYNLYGQGLPVFDPAEDFETYLFVDSLLQLQFPDFEAAGMLHAQITEALAGREKNKQVLRPGVGEIAPDFVSSRPDGSKLSLSDLKGNYILLHFWAGWSSLSREENPGLNEIWNLKGDFPFKILQVSLDGDKERWIQAIEEDGLRWDQVSDLERWESAIANLYSVDKIPSNYLIDPGGKIIAVDLFGGELMEKFKYLKSNY